MGYKSLTEKRREFGISVEELVSSGDMTYMDALVHIMEKENIDEDTMSKLVKKNPVVKMKLELESQKLNLVHKEEQNVLPL
ncbi:MAG TPA: hypothetical protein DCX27_03535 [Balneola sp.]|nr:hypothetical protein [Balneola sp.]|tara:strand:- start:162 stop:404 length:243 start_codon:yes stop_codon:yes gene_type:complete